MNVQSTLNTQRSTESHALPLAWVEKIFRKMHGRFGNQFVDKFRSGESFEVTLMDGNTEERDTGIENAKMVWAEELAGFSGEEIARGMAAKFLYGAPDLDKFQVACRQNVEIDLEVRMQLAITQMSRRRQYLDENWPDNRTFWAAQRIGNDLVVQEPWRLKARWVAAWMDAERDSNRTIPDASTQALLPPPAKRMMTKAQANEQAAQLKLSISGLRNAKSWPLQIAEMAPQAGMVQITSAVLALRGQHEEVPNSLILRARELGLGRQLGLGE
ncbi:MAG: hypothetical protein RL571_3410 [Pseudomonadota bacterium]|jgi:hypothetical protein